MKNRRFRSALCVILMGLCGNLALARDNDVALKELPQAVVDAISAAFPSAKLVRARQRSLHGKAVLYDVKAENNGADMDVYVDASESKILLTATELPVKRLPDLIRESIVRLFPKFNIKRCERATDFKTKQTYYRATVEHSEKTLDLTFDPIGKLVSQEELSADKD